MHSIGRNPPPPPDSRTLKEAEQEAQRDFARLLHAHSPSWSIDIFTSIVRWTCSCESPGPRNAAAMDSHILAVVQKARGPVRGPQKR
jgi:hypothetical protein